MADQPAGELPAAATIEAGSTAATTEDIAAAPTDNGPADAAPEDAAVVVTRHREHRFPGRRRPVQVRFGEEEFAAIELAAGRAGLTPTGYVGAVALAAARGTVPPAPSQSREALTELMATRAQVRRFGGNVNQHHCRRSCGRSRTATRCLHSPAGPGHQARAALKVIADSASGWCGRAGSLPAFSHRCSSPPWSDSATRPRPAWAHRVRLRDA